MEIGRILDITRDSRASEGDSYIIDSPCRSLRLQTGFFSLSTNASRLQQLLNNNSVSSLYLYDVKIELSASTALSQAMAANVNLRTLFSINRHEVPASCARSSVQVKRAWEREHYQWLESQQDHCRTPLGVRQGYR